MNMLARHRVMTIENFLAWEARQETKYEFDGYEPVAMAGGSRNHARVQRNLAIAIGGRLRGTGCEFLGSDMKLLSANRSRYPDGQIICGQSDGDETFTTLPRILFEVVSAGDERRDRVVKAKEYLRIATVTTYVILEQDQMSATVLVRDGDGWTTVQLAGQAALPLPEVGIEVPLAELYEGVEFPPAPSSLRSPAAAQQTETGEADPK